MPDGLESMGTTKNQLIPSKMRKKWVSYHPMMILKRTLLAFVSVPHQMGNGTLDSLYGLGNPSPFELTFDGTSRNGSGQYQSRGAEDIPCLDAAGEMVQTPMMKIVKMFLRPESGSESAAGGCREELEEEDEGEHDEPDGVKLRVMKYPWVLYGNETIFRLHRILNERLLSAKLNSTSSESKVENWKYWF